MLGFMKTDATTILDVCCGTGILTQLVNAKYTHKRENVQYSYNV